MSRNDDIHVAQKLAYEPNGLTLTALTQESESQEYGACTFTMNGKIIVFRTAKITPTKIGQFVTLWKRIGVGPIIPYDMTDQVDFFVISVCNSQNLGQFIFPKDILWQKGFVSRDRKDGKRAMRVYPPWDTPSSQLAKKTQAWQLIYFVEIAPTLDSVKLTKLFL